MDAARREDVTAMLPLRWAQRWESDPSRKVLQSDQVWLTAGELSTRTRQVAHGLNAAGVHRGDRVVWEAASTPEGIIGALAVLRLGAVLVPVSLRQSDIERATVLADVSAAALLGEPRVRHDESIISCDVATLVKTTSCAVELDEVTEGDLAMIVFTSGTTGSPKGAMITHGNIAAQADSLREAWAWSDSDCLLSALPLFHIHGLVVALFTSLSEGGSIVVRPQFDAVDFLEAMARFNITMAFCVPTMLHRLISTPGIEIVASLRLLVSGSAPLSQQLHEEYCAAGTSILERYGMTESLLTLSNPLVGQRRAGTVGFPLPGVVADLPPRGGGEQELRVRGPGIFAGYWNRPDATSEIFAEGWLKTGDVVRVDDDGYVIICGRSKELIITGGFNVYPTEVEDVLKAHPSIDDAAVVGVASEEWGEEVVAYVIIGDHAFQEDTVLSDLREVMSSYKVPRRFVVVDELPRNALGKLQRHLLT